MRLTRGLTVFLSGLPSAGKTTIAGLLEARLSNVTGRIVTLLDGDVVRTHLSSGLGFSKEDRDCNVRRIGFVASEIVRHKGIVICALIAPFDQARREVRAMVEAVGHFILVYVSTPLATCELRDHRGQYAKARAGIIRDFTGISHPYEIPSDAEVTIDSSTISPDEAANKISSYLSSRRLL